MSGNQQNCGRYPGGEEKQTENRRQPVATVDGPLFLHLVVRLIASPSSALARSASYFAPAVSGSRDGLISCYLRSASLRKGQARELEAEALETLPRLRVIGLRVRSRLLLSVEIKSAPPLDLG